MKSVSFLLLLICSILVATAIIMCAPAKELEPYATHNSQAGQPQSGTPLVGGEQISPDEQPVIVETEYDTIPAEIQSVVTDFLLKLGYEIDSIEVKDPVKIEASDVIRWEFSLLKENSDFASVTVLENENRIELFNATVPIGVISDDGADTAPVSIEFFAASLGLDSSKYTEVTWIPETGKTFEYRLYEPQDDFNIVTGRCIINVDLESGGLASVEWRTIRNVDDESSAVSYDKDNAVKAAATWLGEPGMQADHTDLFLSEINPSLAAPGRFCWEIVFGARVVIICSETGVVL